MRYSNSADAIGSKLGPKLVQLIAETITATKLKLLDTEHRARVHSAQTIIDRAGHEVADLYRPVLQEVIRDLDLPPEVRTFLEHAMSGKHQWQALAGFAFSGSGAASSLSTIISNYLAPGVRFAVSKDPQLLPSPETLVALGVKGTMDWPDVYNYAHGQGYADFTLDSLRDGTYQYPDFTTAMELWRRNQISEGQVRTYLTRNGVHPSAQVPLLGLKRVILSPADLADMVIRGIITQAEGTATAAESGVDAADFDKLVLDTGEPIALMQLLEARRRGFIDDARLRRGILQSRIRNEWIDVAEKLAYEPMSVADAINAAVQNHMTLARAEEIAQQNGLEPGQSAILYATAGEPLSRTEMEELYNRGQATQAEVEQALRESRLKNKYITQAFELHRRIPPIFTLQHALRYGGVSEEYAIKSAMEQGYTKQDAAVIVGGASGEKTQTYKDKVVAAVESAYEDNLIPEADAISIIKGLGFTEAEATLIMKGAELRRMVHAVQAVVAVVRAKYVGRRITRNQAIGDLDAAGVPTPQRDQLIVLWDIERSANVRQLTEAQVVKAVKLKLIDEAEGQQRLVQMGYGILDADLLIKGA